MDAVLAVRVLLNQEAAGVVTLQTGATPGGAAGQRAVLSNVRELREAGRNGGWAATSGGAVVCGVKHI